MARLSSRSLFGIRPGMSFPADNGRRLAMKLRPASLPGPRSIGPVRAGEDEIESCGQHHQAHISHQERPALRERLTQHSQGKGGRGQTEECGPTPVRPAALDAALKA